MKMILFASGLLIASVAHADSLSEPIDMSKLTPYEETVHRLAWCHQMAVHMLDREVPKHPFDVSFKVFYLMEDRGYFDKDEDGNEVKYKAKQDLEAEVILGKTFSKEEAAACEKDAKAILKEEYVPNFVYISK